MNVLHQSRYFQLMLEESTNTIVSEWNGEISYDDFKDGLYKLADYVSEHPKSNLVINFRGLTDISARARVWFEDEFMKSDGKATIRKSNSFVLVRPVGVLTNMIVSNFIEICKRSVPMAKYKEAGTISKALKMLDPNAPKSKRSTILSLIPQKIRLNWT